MFVCSTQNINTQEEQTDDDGAFVRKSAVRGKARNAQDCSPMREPSVRKAAVRASELIEQRI